MRTIGLIGGMSWEPSALCYRWINEGVRGKLGGFHPAEIVMHSVDFAPLERMQREGRWEEAAATLVAVAEKVEGGGADFLVLCTNTMHRVAGEISSSVNIPLLHIADATAAEIGARGIRRVGLLATRFTMGEDFFRGRLAGGHGLEVLVPDEGDRRLVHDVIYDELCLGEVREGSRREYRRVISALVDRGAEGIILGCTEITMLLGEEDATVPLFDSTAIHARRAVWVALEGKKPTRMPSDGKMARLQADDKDAILRAYMKGSF